MSSKCLDGRTCIDMKLDTETGEIDGPALTRVPATSDGIEWRFYSLPELKIDRVTFYSDPEKTNEIEPDYLALPGFNSGRLNLHILFNADSSVSEETLYFSVWSTHQGHPHDWDPTLVIEPRETYLPPDKEP